MLQDVEHGDGRATGRGQRGARESRADGRNSGATPGDIGRFKRKVEAGDARAGALLEHLEKEATAAADIQNQTRFLRLADGALDEMEMLAHSDPAVDLLQAIGGGGFGNEPIIPRVVLAELDGRGLGMKADESAVAAFDDLENLRSGAVQAVGCGEQDAADAGAASGTGIAYAACSDNSLSLIR